MRKYVCETCGLKQRIKEYNIRIKDDSRRMYGPCAKCGSEQPMHFAKSIKQS